VSPLAGVNQKFDEIHVFQSVAERTGNSVDRTNIRGRQGICRSLTELGMKTRRLGDGYYYLASDAWPSDKTEIDLRHVWTPLA
jgi:hypothetical protein